MLKTKKQCDRYSEIKETIQNHCSCSVDADVKGLKDSMKADTHRLPFEVLVQIMRAYSGFLAGV